MAISSVATRSPIAVLDEDGVIVGVNRAWRAFGDRNELPEDDTYIGKNYLAISQQADDRYGERVVAELRGLLADEQPEFRVVYPCHSQNQERWVRLYGSAVSFGDGRYYLLVHQRLDPEPPSMEAPSPAEDHGRLVTYSLSADELATDGLFRAFEALGIDVPRQDTPLEDWINTDAINAIKAEMTDFHLTFTVWGYPVSLTPGTVSIYTPEQASE